MQRWCAYLAPARQPFFVGVDDVFMSVDIEGIPDPADDV